MSGSERFTAMLVDAIDDDEMIRRDDIIDMAVANPADAADWVIEGYIEAGHCPNDDELARLWRTGFYFRCLVADTIRNSRHLPLVMRMALLEIVKLCRPWETRKIRRHGEGRLASEQAMAEMDVEIGGVAGVEHRFHILTRRLRAEQVADALASAFHGVDDLDDEIRTRADFDRPRDHHDPGELVIDTLTAAPSAPPRLLPA